MAVQSYPQEVWDRLKEVYETSPKLTWQQLVDLVAEELGCEMPSASVVRRKALAEKWKKRTKSLVKKSARELNNEIKKMTSQKTGRKNSQADDSKDKNKLGKIWAEKSGENYKYFMVFQTKKVDDCYTASSIIEVLKRL